jgi:hypothetical protein
MNVLLVDGPCVGKVMEAREPTFMVPVFRDGQTAINTPYYIHRFYLFGQPLWLASIHSIAEDVRPTDVVSVILSDKAIQALGQ